MKAMTTFKDDLNEYRFSAQLEALYGAWLAHGERALDHGNGRAPDTPGPAAQLVLRELPSTYSQFGSFPGVC